MRLKRQNRDWRAELLPPILLFSGFPLVFGGCKVRSFLGNRPWFPSGEAQYDFFMYAKSIVFLLLAAWMLWLLAERRLFHRQRMTSLRRYIPLFFYAGLVLLSGVLSVNRQLSFAGMWEQYETVWVLLGYVVTAVYCAEMVRDERDVERLMTALGVGALLQGIIGVFQLAGWNFLESGMGKAILTAGVSESVRESLTFSFGTDGGSRVYMTLYNPNYAGVYAVLLLPVTLAAAAAAKKKAQRLVNGVACLLMLVCLVGSGSKTGLFVSVLLAVLMCFLLVFSVKRRKCMAVAFLLGAGLLALFLGYDAVSGSRLQNAVRQSTRRVEEYHLSKLEVQDGAVHMVYRGVSLWMDIQGEGESCLPVVVREKGETKKQAVLKWDEETRMYKIPGKRLRRLRVTAYEEGGVQYLYLECQGIPWLFARDIPGGAFSYVTIYGKTDEIADAACVLRGREKMFSGRGYLWGRTIPLLADHLLWGSGPDTFVSVFPQNDYRMRANTGEGMLFEVPSKAHSLYLQAALQTGGMSLICLLIFWGMYLADSVRLCCCGKEKEWDGSWLVRTGISFGVAGYLLMGLLNDSVVAVAPVFWGVLGLGMAVNRQVKSRRISS